MCFFNDRYTERIPTVMDYYKTLEILTKTLIKRSPPFSWYSRLSKIAFILIFHSSFDHSFYLMWLRSCLQSRSIKRTATNGICHWKPGYKSSQRQLFFHFGLLFQDSSLRRRMVESELLPPWLDIIQVIYPPELLGSSSFSTLKLHIPLFYLTWGQNN